MIILRLIQKRFLIVIHNFTIRDNNFLICGTSIWAVNVFLYYYYIQRNIVNSVFYVY